MAIKTFNGTAAASVKTVNGIAVASVKTWNGISFETQFPSISGLQARYRADLGVSESGGSVSQWNDQSANSYHLTNAGGATMPTYGASSGPNSKPAISFNGSSNYLTNSISGSSAQPFHVFAVVKQTSWSSGRTLWNLNSSGEARMRQISSSPQIAQSGTSSNVNASSPTLGTWFLVQDCRKGDNTTGYTVLNNGSPSTGGNPGGGVAFNHLDIGMFVSNGDQWADIVVAEFCIYSAEITGTDLTNLLSYFNSRYALW